MMARLSVPAETLPNNGQVRHPNLETADARDVLAAYALQPEGGPEAAAQWARQAHDQENTRLRTDAETRLKTVEQAAEITDEIIDRHRRELTVTQPIKAVITRAIAVGRTHRATLDRLFIPIGILMVLVVAFAEAKLLNKAVITSGLFSLLPGDLGDELFAWAFAALPLAIGLIIRSRVALLNSRERADASASLTRNSRTLVKVWAVLVALTFGPHFITISGLVGDPFADQPAWAETSSGFLVEFQLLLQQLSALEIILLMGISLITASIVIGTLLVNDREADGRARIEHVRDDETTQHCEKRIAALLEDKLATDADATGRLRAILAELDADRTAFAELVSARVRHMQTVGELQRRQAILSIADGGKLIDAGPLFSRR